MLIVVVGDRTAQPHSAFTAAFASRLAKRSCSRESSKTVMRKSLELFHLLRRQRRSSSRLGDLRFLQNLFRAWQTGEDIRRDKPIAHELGQALLPLVQCLVWTAFFAEAGFGGGAAVFEGGVDVAAEEGGDVHFDLLASGFMLVDLVAVDRSRLVFGEHDGDLGADAGAGGAVGLAVVVVLHLDLVVFADAIDIEEAEAEALHAVGTAGVVDDGEPGLPFAGFVHGFLAARFVHQRDDGVGFHAGDVAGVDSDLAGGVFQRGGFALKGPEHEQVALVMRHGRRAEAAAGDGVAFVEQGHHDLGAGLGGKLDAAVAFVEDDAEWAVSVGDHEGKGVGAGGRNRREE